MSEILVAQAHRMYFERYGDEAHVPSNASDIEQYDDRDYVVLGNVNGPRAVYLVTSVPDGFGGVNELERDNWPSDLKEQ